MRAGLIGLALGAVIGLALPCAAGDMKWTPIPEDGAYCDNVEAIEAKLAARQGERLVVTGTERKKGQYRLYYSDHSGSWTMVWVDLDGVACIRLVGRHRVAMFGIGT